MSGARSSSLTGVCAGPRPTRAALAWVTTLALTLGCAPIDVSNTVTLRPREGPTRQFGGEQLVGRDFIADYVQLGPRLLVELRELQSCAVARHSPVLRVEEVERRNRNFVIWDFGLGLFTGGFAALAFARPELFSAKLTDGDGRVIHDESSAYLVGGIFAAICAGLLTAGIVDALRSRDETRYADAYEVSLGPAQACAGAEARPLAGRRLHLVVDGALELEAETDASGRARFVLPSSLTAPDGGSSVPAVIEIMQLDGADSEDKVLVLTLRAPFAGMVDAHTGVADTRTETAPEHAGAAMELAPAEHAPGPVEGPAPEPAEHLPDRGSR